MYLLILRSFREILTFQNFLQMHENPHFQMQKKEKEEASESFNKLLINQFYKYPRANFLSFQLECRAEYSSLPPN